MSRKKYTVFMVSEDGEATRKFHVSQRGYRIVFILIAVILITAVGSVVYFTPRIIDYGRLKRQHQALMTERIKLAGLLRDLRRIREMDSFIRQSLGMDLEFALGQEAISVPGKLSEKYSGEKIPISFLENVPSYVPVDGFMTQDFYRSPVSRTDDHLGLDIATKAGSAIHTTASGMVVFSGWTYGYGNLVIVYHGDDYFSLYGHNQRNLVEERQILERGEVVALVGESGLSTGPHLHFEIWKDGIPVDPKEFITTYREEEFFSKTDG